MAAFRGTSCPQQRCLELGTGKAIPSSSEGNIPHPTGATQRPAGLPIHKEKAFPFHSPLPFLKFSYSVFLSFCCLIFFLSFTHPRWCPFLTGGTSASRDRAAPCWVSTNSAYSRRGKSN